MTIASFLSRRRRMLAICAASALLHGVAIGWVGTRLAPGMDSLEDRTQPIVTALLIPAPPAPAAAPAAKVASQPAPPPAPVEPDVQASVPEPAASAEPIVEPLTDPPSQVLAEAPLPQPDIALDSALPEAPAPVPDAALPDAEQPAVPRYRVSLPPAARLVFDVTRKEANGTEWQGSSDMHWQPSGASYRLTMQAFVAMLVTRVNVGTVISEGALTDDGIAPRRVTEKRMGRSQTATHFDAAGQRITFSTSERSVPLLAGAQDKASVQFQLAGIARADSAQLAGGVQIQVSSERDAPPYRFMLAGEEEIDTPMGRIATWRLTRPPLPGSYNARLDIWLAPQHGWLPVKVRSAESKGAVTTQTIKSIVATDSDHP